MLIVSMNKSFTIQIRAFKNRNQVSINNYREIYKNGSFWSNLKVNLTRNEDIDYKYPNYEVYSNNLIDEDKFNIIPAKTTIMIRLYDDLNRADRIFSFNRQYETINNETERKLVNGTIIFDIKDKPKIGSLDGLKDIIWWQLGSKEDEIIFLLKLKKRSFVDGLDCDDLTGDVYCYHINQVYMLIKK